MEEIPADLVFAEAAQQGGLGASKIEAAGQRRERPATIGIGCLAQVGLDQPELGVARRLEGEGVEQLGKGLHQGLLMAGTAALQCRS